MNNDLTKQIIELEKNNDRLKIEKLLEDKLRDDPENIDLLFRLTCLELYMPFKDYYACYICLEKIMSICRKYETIASSCMDYINSGFPRGDAPKPDFLYFVLRQATFWFYEAKKSWMHNKTIKQLIEDGKIDYPEKIRIELEEKLKQKPEDIDSLFFLALVELLCFDANIKKSVAHLEKMLTIVNDQHAIAAIFYTYVKDIWLGINEKQLNELKNMHSEDAEINSMLKYAISLFYRQTENAQLEEKFLKESIAFYQGHVWNYVHLAKLYNNQGLKNQAEELINRARINVKKKYADSGFANYDPTSLNEYLNQLIKGTYVKDMSLIKV